MKGIGYIADAVEFRTWAKKEPYTFNSLEDDLKASIDEDEYAESLPQKVMDEIQSRHEILKGAYPFECDGYKVRVAVDDASTFTYMFCLGLSLLPPAYIENEQRAQQFETIATRAAKEFFGGSAIRIGAPWKCDAIPTYAALLDQIASLVPNLGERIRDEAPNGGDGGWDVLVVKNFLDNQFPRFIALGNCATGRTDWKRKGKETEPGYIWEFFAHGHRSVLITFFVVPYVMDEDVKLRKLGILTFDRFRLCEHAADSGVDAAAWIESVRDAALEVPFN
jgi:hypothetical protein